MFTTSEFEKEYNSIKKKIEHSKNYSLHDLNKLKNRWKNIIPYDYNRVKLDDTDTVSDYINASYITGYGNKEKKYIATQGPLNKPSINTVPDFWRMIANENVKIIVMVAQTVEKGEPKCAKYWPNEGDVMKINPGMNMEIKTTYENKGSYTVRNIIISRTGHEEQKITHYQMTSWPDHGIPTNPTDFINMSNEIRKKESELKSAQPEYDSPMVVHCSAGVGRTGVFIAFDINRDRLEATATADTDPTIADTDPTIEVYQTLHGMRQERPEVIQTLAQYIFVHTALLELLNTIQEDEV